MELWGSCSWQQFRVRRKPPITQAQPADRGYGGALTGTPRHRWMRAGETDAEVAEVVLEGGAEGAGRALDPANGGELVVTRSVGCRVAVSTDT